MMLDDDFILDFDYQVLILATPLLFKLPGQELGSSS